MRTSRTRRSRSAPVARSRSARRSVLASRISYVGELGWELYVPLSRARGVAGALRGRQPHGLVPVGIGVYGTTGRIEKGYRATVPSSTSSARWPRPGCRRKVKDQDFVGKAALLEQSAQDPVTILCTLTVDDHTSADGSARYMLGREPVLTADGDPITDKRGHRSYVTSAGSAPSLGTHLLMTYLPPEYAVEGTRLVGGVHGRAVPVHGRPGRRHAAVRPRQRPDQGVAGMEVLVCVKRVPGASGRVTLTDDGRAVDARHVGWTVSPHEESAVECAVQAVEAQGGSATVLSVGTEDSLEQMRDALAMGVGCGGAGRGRRRRLGSVRRRGRDRRRRDRAPRRRAAVRPAPVRQRGRRHRGLPGRDPGGVPARAPGGGRGEDLRGQGRPAGRAPRGPGRCRGVRRPDAGGATVKEGGVVPRYPSVPGRIRAKKAPVDRVAPTVQPVGNGRVLLTLPPEETHDGGDPRQRRRRGARGRGPVRAARAGGR